MITELNIHQAADHAIGAAEVISRAGGILNIVAFGKKGSRTIQRYWFTVGHPERSSQEADRLYGFVTRLNQRAFRRLDRQISEVHLTQPLNPWLYDKLQLCADLKRIKKSA